MAWMHFSSILEPYNLTITCGGSLDLTHSKVFPTVHDKDLKRSSQYLYQHALNIHTSVYEELGHLAALHDRNRPLGHIPKVTLIKGDACSEIPTFIESNPHLLISLLYLDFDIYEPTVVALKALYSP